MSLPPLPSRSMGYHTTFTGTVTVDPPLSPRQRGWIATLWSPPRYPDGSLALGYPGWSSPWVPTAEGGLHIPDSMDRPRQAPEWLAWIANELHEPIFSRDPEIGGTHTMTGRLRAQGGCEGDKYELRVTSGRISVHRKGLPCWPCWLDVQWLVPPSAAYAFAHPEEHRGARAEFTEEERDRDEPHCRAAAWAPQPRWRRVYWPPRFGDWWAEHVASLDSDP